ncbi:hypothetical protein [Orenia marismortui]|uniref:Methyl-accepting chemotaxis protein n=1 Tax=Orenia marismortui TaxID=46469 RepID=A0A4R8HPY9_9FIRM|nr:hypothetical protein [Orenia marismortui]TDX58991.1 hypothetical protein C7959_102129 [Orenia marismortui]
MVKEVEENARISAEKTVKLIQNITANLENNTVTEEQSTTIHEIAEAAQLLAHTSNNMQELVEKLQG